MMCGCQFLRFSPKCLEQNTYISVVILSLDVKISCHVLTLGTASSVVCRIRYDVWSMSCSNACKLAIFQSQSAKLTKMSFFFFQLTLQLLISDVN